MSAYKDIGRVHKVAKNYKEYLEEAVAKGQLPEYYLKESKKDTEPIGGEEDDDYAQN